MINLEKSLLKHITKEANPESIFPNNEIIKHLENFEDNINAVTICIICDNSLLFIKRSDEMPTYSGHIAFLGGHLNEGETFLEAAKREFFEETSLDSKVLDHIGYLRIVLAKNFRPILPVVFKLNISKEELIERAKTNGEWTDIFWVDINTLNDHSRWKIEQRTYKGLDMKVHYFDLMQEDRFSQSNIDSDYVLWGATGRIVYKLTKLLRKSLNS